MPMMQMSDTGAIPLKGGTDSVDPTRNTRQSVAECAVNDGLMIIVGSMILLVLLMFSLRTHTV